MNYTATCHEVDRALETIAVMGGIRVCHNNSPGLPVLIWLEYVQCDCNTQMHADPSSHMCNMIRLLITCSHYHLLISHGMSLVAVLLKSTQLPRNNNLLLTVTHYANGGDYIINQRSCLMQPSN